MACTSLSDSICRRLLLISFDPQYFAREMLVWSGLRHTNVIELVGYLYDEARNPMFVSRWMDNGSALDYVKRCPTVDVFQLVQGIAQGLDYLHNSNVVHSDIKSVSDPNGPSSCHDDVIIL